MKEGVSMEFSLGKHYNVRVGVRPLSMKCILRGGSTAVFESSKEEKATVSTLECNFGMIIASSEPAWIGRPLFFFRKNE